jgi:SPP1 family predicted phage head-tail adaptor
MRMRDELIFFMDMVPSGGRNGYGDPELKEEVSGPVYAEIRSIGQNEFYQAQTSGLKPELKFRITDHMDYQGQKYLVHEGVRYTILRTYRTGNELEITCYGGVRDANTAVGDQD